MATARTSDVGAHNIVKFCMIERYTFEYYETFNVRLTIFGRPRTENLMRLTAEHLERYHKHW
jgi:hypothetical protein